MPLPKKPLSNKDYMSGLCSFEEYYSQYVTPHITAQVVNHFGLDALLNSKDYHFNDIPLKRWDKIYLPYSCSLADSVCIAKQAARELVKEHKSKDENNANTI